MKYFLLILFFSLSAFSQDLPYVAPLGTDTGKTATGLGPATSETIRIALADGASIAVSGVTTRAGNVDGNPVADLGLFTNSRGYVFGGTWDRIRSVGIGNNTQGIGLPATGVWGQLPNGFYSAFALDSLARLSIRPLTAASDTVTVSGGATASGQTDTITAVNNLSVSNTLITSTTATAIISAINSASTSATSSLFTRIKQREFFNTEEVLYDIPASIPSGFIYVGLATAGTSSSTAAWSIVRTSFDSNGNPSGDKFKTGVSWTARTVLSW